MRLLLRSARFTVHGKPLGLLRDERPWRCRAEQRQKLQDGSRVSPLR
jgi:hypothetical protein